MIPSLLYLGVLAGILTGRSWVLTLLAIPAFGIAWAFLILGMDGDLSVLPGAFALGAANAAVGVLVGACVRGVVEAFSGPEAGR